MGFAFISSLRLNFRYRLRFTIERQRFFTSIKPTTVPHLTVLSRWVRGLFPKRPATDAGKSDHILCRRSTDCLAGSGSLLTWHNERGILFAQKPRGIDSEGAACWDPGGHGAERCHGQQNSEKNEGIARSRESDEVGHQMAG